MTVKRNREEWKALIIQNCQAVGTFQAAFEPVIDTLAGILETRDQALDTFERSGGSILVKHTNKGGSTNLEQNPALRMVNDLNRDAMMYWRDLGLTPSGLKKINEDAIKPKKANALAEALRELDG